MQSGFCVLDLAHQSLGRMCSIAAKLLISSATVNPVLKLVFVNSSKTKPNDRLMGKCYYHHTGYPGGIKRKLASSFGRKTLILKVLRNMLPKTRTYRSALSRVVFSSVLAFPVSRNKLSFASTNI
ncbi:MAG: uL13 family ribosomal protein [Candidatus Hodgkinia cicadicola]